MSGAYVLDFDFDAPSSSLHICRSDFSHPKSTHETAVDAHPLNHAVCFVVDQELG